MAGLETSGLPLLSLIVFTPLIGVAALLLIPGRNHRLINWVALLAALASLGLQRPAMVGYDPAGAEFQFREDIPWIDAFGIRYTLGVDGMSAVLVLLTTRPERGRDPLLLGPDPEPDQGVLRRDAAPDDRHARRVRGPRPVRVLRVLGAEPDPDVPGHRHLGRAEPDLRHGQVRDLHPGRLAAHAGRHPGRGHRQREPRAARSRSATRPFAGCRTPTCSRPAAFIAFGLAFAIKVPMWPFHTWLPDAHVEAPTAGSIILAGVLLKLGGYGFLRFSLPILPDAAASFAPLMIGLALIAILYGALVAMVQPDLKKLIAYSSVSPHGLRDPGRVRLQPAGHAGRDLPDGQPRDHDRGPVPPGRA